MTRPLTEKEKKIIATFERMRPGLGKFAERDILDPNTGWAEIIEDMDNKNFKAITRDPSKGFIAQWKSLVSRRIGG
jgi:uncharacterized protein YjgD (DUF1641 family)